MNGKNELYVKCKSERRKGKVRKSKNERMLKNVI